MRQVSKFTRLSVATVMTAALVAMPSLAVEVTDTEDSAPLTATNLCSRIGGVTTDSNNAISERRQTVQTNFSDRLVRLETNRAAVEDKVTTARQQASTTFNEKIDELKAMPGLTEDQLKAIDTFKTDMTKAETTRQQSVDTARQIYQSGMRQIVSDRQDVLSEATATYNAAVTTALEKTKSNCSSSSALITMRSELKAARNAFTSALQATKPSEDIRLIAETRNSAIQEANRTFRASAKEYSETLAKSLGITITITLETTTES